MGITAVRLVCELQRRLSQTDLLGSSLYVWVGGGGGGGRLAGVGLEGEACSFTRVFEQDKEQFQQPNKEVGARVFQNTSMLRI